MKATRHYRLLRELASGSFGSVYLAEMSAQGDFRKQVALKILHQGWSEDPDAVRRFRDEARLLGQIRHRHVIQVDGLVELGGRWALVMEYVPGADLNTVAKACRRAGAPMPVATSLEIVAAVASALDAAWSAKSEDGQPLRVIHRDIKPGNIRITPDGDLKVLDFGVARASFESREATTERIRFGTLRYMAPERRWGKPDAPSGDVYSLGCVLYEILAGGPFGNAEQLPEDHDKRVAEKIERLTHRLGPDNAPVIELVRDLIDFWPEQRPTAGQVYERARTLAKAATDEDLGTFARRFVPRVHDFVPDESVEMAPQNSSASMSRPVTAPQTTSPTNTANAQDQRLGLAIMGTAALAAAAIVLSLVALSTWSRTGAVAADPDTDLHSAPAPAPAPAPTAAPAPAPADPTTTVDAPVRVPKTAPRATPPPTAPPAPAYTGPRLRSAKFTMTTARSITATCGDRSAEGTTAAVVRDLPVGTCRITAVDLDGQTWRTDVAVSEARGVTCFVSGGLLSCE